MKPQSLTTLKYLLVVTLFILIALAVLFTLRPQSSVGLTGIGGDFTLQSERGPVSLSDYRGKVVALYFGYASCPDICPTSLAVMTQAFNALTEAEQTQVQGIFVSVDPDRDTPDKLAAYAGFFHPGILGITGTQQEIDQVVADYGAFYRKVEMPNSAMGYAVDHSSRIYLIDQQGKFRQAFMHNSSPPELTKALQQLIHKEK